MQYWIKSCHFHAVCSSHLLTYVTYLAKMLVHLPGASSDPKITAVAETAWMLCIRDLPRRLKLIRAGTTPILVHPSQSPMYSSRFSMKRAILSPCLKPAFRRKLANWLLYSSNCKQIWNLISYYIDRNSRDCQITCLKVQLSSSKYIQTLSGWLLTVLWNTWETVNCLFW